MAITKKNIRNKVKAVYESAKKMRAAWGEWTKVDEDRVDAILASSDETAAKKVNWISRVTKDPRRLVRRAFVFEAKGHKDFADIFFGRAFQLIKE